MHLCILNKTTYKYNSLCVEIQQYSTQTPLWYKENEMLRSGAHNKILHDQRS